MDSNRGRLTLAQLKEKIERGLIDTVIVAYVDQYGQLLGKRLTGEYFLEGQEIAGCNYVMTANIEMQPMPGFSLTSWEKGFGDFQFTPDYSTIREIPWRPGSALLLADLTDSNGKPVVQSPRAMLKRQCDAYAQKGMKVFAASELEFFLFDSSYADVYKGGKEGLIPSSNYPIDYHILGGEYREDIIGEMRKTMGETGIPVESSKGETGLGQHEIALEYAQALEMADRHVIYKHGIKAIAEKHRSSVTFMAKYSHNDSGSSCHIHMSVWDVVKNENLFAGESELFQHFIAGVLELTPQMFLFYAPTINSYKRFCKGSFAPFNVSWDYDNRTVGYRIVGKGRSYRMENRYPGADVNPYTAYAAMLGAGMYGIEHSLRLPERTEGDSYGKTGVRQIPRSLQEAADIMDASEQVRAIFGDSVVDHYVHHARVETQEYLQQVTSWELKRYFERI
jgi:glutamine synthetase